jgi:hypothetical protein
VNARGADKVLWGAGNGGDEEMGWSSGEAGGGSGDDGDVNLRRETIP